MRHVDRSRKKLSSMIRCVMRALMSRVGAGLTFGAWALLLLLGLFPSAFVRLMVTDDAAGAGAENAMMAGIMPGDTADGRAL